MARLDKNYFKNLSWDEINNMKGKELRRVLEKARDLYERQAIKFEGLTGSKVYSPSYEKMKGFYESKAPKGKGQFSQLNRSLKNVKVNDLKSELYRLSNFFESETSTVQGARKYEIRQDTQIFGENDAGRPVYRMNKEERSKFWSLYNEYKSTFKTSETIYGSGRIQQFLGDMIANDGEIDISMETLERLNQKLINSRTPEFPYNSSNVFKSASERMPNVYSGNWNPFNR